MERFTSERMKKWLADKKFVLEYSPDQGRYCRSIEDLPAGTEIIREAGYAVIVNNEDVKTMCMYCFYGIDKDNEPEKVLTACLDCKAVHYCSAQCRRLDQLFHSRFFECKVLRAISNGAASLWTSNSDSIELISQLRMILRLLARRYAEKLVESSDKVPDAIREQVSNYPFRFDDYLSFVTNEEHFSKEMKSYVQDTVGMYACDLAAWTGASFHSLCESPLFVRNMVLRNLNNQFGIQQDICPARTKPAPKPHFFFNDRESNNGEESLQSDKLINDVIQLWLEIW
jgi:hypothetical protein